MSDSSTIKVTEIDSKTTEEDIKNFFSFCGKISSIELEGSDPKSATIVFEKYTAAKTALLLDNTTLNGKSMSVKSVSDGGAADSRRKSSPVNGDLRQEDKPRTAILAEMLAHGYTLSDTVLHKGIEFDKSNGISDRVTVALKKMEERFHVQDRVQKTNETYHVSDTLNSWYKYFYDYLNQTVNQTLETQTGQKVRKVYDDTAKHIRETHEKAKEIQQKKNGGSPYTGTTATALEKAVSPVATPAPQE